MERKPSGVSLSEAEEMVQEAYAEKDYRPTVVALIRDIKDRVLLVRSAFDARTWYFPQGGVGKDEGLITAFYREIFEELRIMAQDIKHVHFRCMTDIEASRDRKNRRGFTKGKRYFTFEAVYRGPEQLLVQPKEVDDYDWVEPELVPVKTQHTREEKRQFMLHLLGIPTGC